MGKPENREGRLCPHVPKRMGPTSLWESQVKCGRMPEPGFRPFSRTMSFTPIPTWGEQPAIRRISLRVSIRCFRTRRVGSLLLISTRSPGCRMSRRSVIPPRAKESRSPPSERSRSGNGAHAWIFFAEPVPATDARRLGALLVTATMDRCPDIGFDSQRSVLSEPGHDAFRRPGNLIALPPQHRPRENGNSVFLDDDFHPYEDQWAYLADDRPFCHGAN